MNAARCRMCGRGLRNPKWVALGIGPVCARKIRRQLATDDLLSTRARYEVVKATADLVWIRDRDDGARSVTNDAAGVVRDLHLLYPGARVIYRDSAGRWDELKHDGRGGFTGFAPAPMTP